MTASLADQLEIYESLVLDVKDEVLAAYHLRCAVTESECAYLHLDACRSRFPGGVCTQEDNIDICLEEDCGMTRDYDNPTVRLPESVADGENLNPTDGDTIETMCYSVLLNTPLRDLYAVASESGASAVYFGAWTGVFRYFPGIAQSECGTYDCRIRPWYVAASSGPKDVLIVLDISGSMSQYGRLQLAKDAAETVIRTLGGSSFVNVVTFSETAQVLLTNTTTLVRATEENIEELVGLVQNLEFDLANVATNFGAAFETAFDVLEASQLATDSSAFCQTAIVFLTDGNTNVGLSTQETIDLISERNIDTQAQVFTYSLGTLADKETAKQIACDTGGIYEHVEDGGDLSQSMAFFYRYYAMGLGDNEDFVAVTELYEFTTNDDLGFTVAAPVYDTNSTNSNQPVFLGVVAMDFKVETFVEQGYTEDEVRDALQRESELCPSLSLTECQRQVFRGSISSLSVCNDTTVDEGGCSEVGSLMPIRCMAESEYPSDLWQNTDLEGVSYTERTCCGSNYSSISIEPSCLIGEEAESSDDDRSSSIWVGLAGGVAAAMGLILIVAFSFHRRKKNRTSKTNRDMMVEAVGPPGNAPRNLNLDLDVRQ